MFVIKAQYDGDEETHYIPFNTAIRYALKKGVVEFTDISAEEV